MDSRALSAYPVETELLDAECVSQLCGCSMRSIRRMSDARRMPKPIRLGRLVRWRRTEIMRWIEEGCPPIHAGRRS